jgi:hypothetical protein
MFGVLKKAFVRKVGELEAKLTLYSQPFQKAGEVEFEFFSDGVIKAEAKLGFLGETETKRVVVHVNKTPLFPVNSTLGFAGCKDIRIQRHFKEIIKPGAKIIVTVDGSPYAAGILKLD